MRRVDRSALVPYSPEQMYVLVQDVARYPEFLPWCSGAEVHERKDAELSASIKIGFGAFNSSFSTRNLLTPPTAMTMELVDGPFSSLAGRWEFEQLGDTGSEVRLRVEFEFASTAQDALFGSVFEKICNDLIDAFIARARTLYND